MERVCFLLKVKADRLDEYKRRHAQVWEEMRQALHETGWHNYSLFLREDGLLFDPWLRTHERLGAEVLGTADEAMRIPGTIAHWQEWTGMWFPESGAYVVPGALVPVEIDVERDEGLYVEPCVWMRHPR